MNVSADRWIEIDLYWFDRDHLEGSVTEFWDRFEPLLHGVDGWRGVIINAGWLVDHVLDWRGNFAEQIPVPQGLRKDKFFPDTQPLTGTDEERFAGWKARFDERGQRDTDSYQAWSYGDLKNLASQLRNHAETVHDLPGVLIGTFVLGWLSIYDCAPSGWATRHPEGFFQGPWRDELFNVVAELTADGTSYGAYPDGHPAGLPISTFFGKQWGSLAGAVGLDAIVLRDSMIGQGIYERVGPYGDTAPANPALVARWTDATAALVRETKQAAPQTLVIGYSNAASAVADWRVNCVDLEMIAREGFLDAWIDQTWAGAWGEVGQRENTFYNEPSLGWTNHLGYMLGHAAALAGTKVKHYTLAETFDAWESWDIIHTAPERLRWGIWAYLHAFLKTPDGVKAPDGTYVSWLNQGKRLLTSDDVDFLAENINKATQDARNTVDVFGPTAVYSRPAMEWQSRNAPEADIKEWIDEQVGMLAKFSVPVTSITRSEWLNDVSSDYIIVQTPVHLPEAQTRAILDRIDRGLPTMVVGTPGGGVDPRIAARAGLTSTSDRAGATKTEATFVSGGHDVPEKFAIIQPWTRNETTATTQVVYEVDGSPALVTQGAIAAWDAPDFIHRGFDDLGLNHSGPRSDRSMAAKMGSPYPYLLTARVIHNILRHSGTLAAAEITVQHPVALSGWKLRDGTIQIMVAQLEEGFRPNTAGTDTLEVQIPGMSIPLRIDLQYGQSRFFSVVGDSAKQSFKRLR